MKNLFKKKETEPIFNLSHPDIKDSVELAFTSGGREYFRFKDEREIPAGRYVHIDAFLKEHEIRMDLETLRGYIQLMEDELSAKEGEIKVQNIAVILYKMKTRVNLAWNLDTIKRLASVVYFDKTEVLRGYDEEYGRKKIAWWDENKTLDFFLQTPIVELLGLQGITETFLQTYIQEQTQVLQDLYSIPSPSSAATS
jgi:hypothetical protein